MIKTIFNNSHRATIVHKQIENQIIKDMHLSLKNQIIIGYYQSGYESDSIWICSKDMNSYKI